MNVPFAPGTQSQNTRPHEELPTCVDHSAVFPPSARLLLCAVYVGKTETEFFDTETVPWTPVTLRPGVSERVLARDPSRGLLTRMVRWEAGLDTSADGPVAHDYFEEVLILSGSMHDLRLKQTFSAGSYACRPPGMVHGPWTTVDGCVMLEIQYAADQALSPDQRRQ